MRARPDDARRDQPERLRDIAGPLFRRLAPALRTDLVLRLAYQAATETASQAIDAPAKATRTLLSSVSQKTAANESMPSAPSAAPTASRAAACCPRRSPAKPASRFFRISCFSISVALAQKMAGSARKSPPTDAP